MNLNIVNATVNGSLYVGILTGHNRGTITSCSIQGNCSGIDNVGGLTGFNRGTIEDIHCAGVVNGYWAVGGLVGYNIAEMSSCSFDGEVTGENSVGGLIGRSNQGIIHSCCSRGIIKGEERIGGLVGDNGGSIISSYSTCKVTGTKDYIGGLVGISAGPGDQLAYCYSTGHVIGGDHTGGLVGAADDRAYNCYWDIEASGMPTSWTGMGRSTHEMKSKETFRGWGYPGVWTIDDGQDYPRLIWEQAPGQLIIDPETRYSGGTGEMNSPYEISTADDLVNLAYYQQDFDKHYFLTNDIDLSSVKPNLLTPIGTRSIPFTGVFDGKSHIITNFNYVDNYESSIGIFGAIEKTTTEQEGICGLLENLGVTNTNISGQSMAGALVGYNAGTIISCYSADSSIESPWNAGGLVGHNGGSIITSWSSNTVIGRSNIGGLVGNNGRTIESCYSTTNVKGEQRVGGLVGASSGTITGCYSTGMVSGEIDTGGLLGANVGNVHNSWGEIFVSLWDTQNSGFLNGVGNLESDPIGALGKTTAEMQTAGTFIEAGWDFVNETENGMEDIWWILEGQDYPRLWWEAEGN